MNTITLLAIEAVSIIDKNAALVGYCRGFIISVLALLLMGLAFVAGTDFGMAQMGGAHKAHKLVEVVIFIFIAVDSGEAAHFPMVGATGKIITEGHLSDVISKWE